jgi:hypothetical protein
MNFEHLSEPVLPGHLFLRRISLHAAVAFGLLVLSLALGVSGYHVLARLSWVDSFLNATMILGGMGQVSTLENDSAKLFASFYALYSGVAFLAVSAVLIAPFAHRLLHRLHLEDSDSGTR